MAAGARRLGGLETLPCALEVPLRQRVPDAAEQCRGPLGVAAGRGTQSANQLVDLTRAGVLQMRRRTERAATESRTEDEKSATSVSNCPR